MSRTAMALAVAREAAAIDDIETAYVRWDECEFIMRGASREGSTYYKVAEALVRVASKMHSREVDGRYSPLSCAPKIEGWTVVYSRGNK